MKKLRIVGIGACAFALCFALAGCSGGGDAADTATDTATDAAATATDAATTATDTATTATDAAAAGVTTAAEGTFDISGVDFSNIGATIEFGDFEGMKALSKDIQNGKVPGTVVKIDGLVSHPGTKYSIVESDGEGASIGTVFVFADGSDAYPADGTHVILTGVVTLTDPTYAAYSIVTTPDLVQVVE